MIKKDYEINYIRVIDENKIIINGKKHLLCLCKCGSVKPILEATLKSNRIRDCGCGTYMLNKYIGKNFGKLTVHECYRKRLSGRINIIAKCICECGKEKEFPISELNKGKILSCGCLNKYKYNKIYKGKIYNGIEILEIIDENKIKALCKCHCGNIFETKLYNLTSKNRYIINCNKCSNTNHLQWNKANKKNRLRSIYDGMLRRCNNKEHKDYKYYGLKGVKICQQWQGENGFYNFYEWAINNGYELNLTIDRINSNGNYEPNNCRWVSWQIQQNNRKSNVKFFIDNEYLSMAQISRKYNINPRTLRSRLKQQKMTIHEAISIPIRKRG